MILTLFSSLYYGALARRHLGYRVTQAMALAAIIAFSAQLVILLSTLASFVVGASYFTHPVAVNVITWDEYLAALKQGAALAPVGLRDALPPRLFGLFANTISGSIVGALGWAMGALLPKPSED
jgi:formyltetrahydrofolate synthetase